MKQFRVLYLPNLTKDHELCSLFFLADTFSQVVRLFMESTNLTENHIFTIRVVN